MSGGLCLLAVDDEAPALADLARLLRKDPRVGEVVCAGSGGDALRTLSERSFDGVFVDVRMPDLDGLELAGVLRRFAAPPGLVFVSAHEDAAIHAFELRALDYLMKPVSRQRVEQAVARVAETGQARPRDAVVAERPPQANDILPVDSVRGGGTRLVHRSEILYLQSHGDYVRIVCDHGRYLLRGPLSDIERRWQQHGFVRVHRTYVANLRRAIEVRPALNGTAAIVFADGSEIPVARRQMPELRRLLRA